MWKMHLSILTSFLNLRNDPLAAFTQGSGKVTRVGESQAIFLPKTNRICQQLRVMSGQVGSNSKVAVRQDCPVPTGRYMISTYLMCSKPANRMSQEISKNHLQYHHLSSQFIVLILVMNVIRYDMFIQSTYCIYLV
ncbi:hypothetical protein ElyMa_001876200 [Elysia marginata]|uniref:Uncharacterized protein n=1 Tax=Elysia marginata TaxID=1093978 RepID=A0AAV4ENL5_9GAST|nr:hypothetical protein ElyMa_001876200 [Elysia marginata]